MSSCSLHEKKEMNEGMALLLNKISDKSFVPDKKYVDQMDGHQFSEMNEICVNSHNYEMEE